MVTLDYFYFPLGLHILWNFCGKIRGEKTGQTLTHHRYTTGKPIITQEAQPGLSTAIAIISNRVAVCHYTQSN
jgi:hypothetical protein